ncbi:UvrD/REP helicase family protein [Hokovirus HKV1]|uniref:DNA 3'-5' helicase n=1 Tax=Hokovirus HKV1 TaxID=1977638 RepID=A0A1V0SG90_9VIRU|nr:UvrD/REP helicase family protein [Hokovirus HKV1]
MNETQTTAKTTTKSKPKSEPKTIIKTESKTKTELLTEINKTKLVSNVSKYNKNQLNDLYDKIQNYLNNEKSINLSLEQENIIKCDIGNNIRVIAGAGSGKTTTIIYRIKYLIDNKVRPNRIILMTFNVDAAKNMKRKLKEIFGFKPNILVGTIDSISCKLYYRYFKKDYYVGVQEFSTELLKYLQSNNGYVITNQYDYVFIDEFQDVNSIQYNILMEFYKNNTKITVIGDDSQNIYSFRGANIDYIINIDQDIEYLKTFTITNNYRSTPEIIDFANKSISNNKKQIQKTMLAINNTINIKPELEYFNNINDMSFKILNKISTLIKNNIRYGNIAILSRNNIQLKKIEEYIEKYNNTNQNKIPYVSLLTDDLCDIKAKINFECLTISTIHKSKGLEWDCVFLIGCEDYNFPSRKDIINIEEERRLFYVATTRAKKYLYFYMEHNSKYPNFVSRFVQEVPKTLYNYINNDPKIYGLSTHEKFYYEEDIFKIIKSFDDNDILYLRNNNMITETPQVNILYPSTTLDQKIIDEGTSSDFYNFINVYIFRFIEYNNIKKEHDKNIFYREAFVISHSIRLNEEDYTLYSQYETLIKQELNIYYKNIKKNKNKYLEYELLKNVINKNILLPHVYKINVLLRNITNIVVTYNVNPKYILIIKDFSISDDLKKKLCISYKEYFNKYKNNNQVLLHIYNVSLCKQIQYNRKRMLYKDYFYNIFKDNIKIIMPMIDEYVTFLINDNYNATTNKYIRNKKYSLNGIYDWYFNDTLLLIRCSNDDNFMLDWYLQSIGLVSLMFHKNIFIYNVIIYNPIRGLEYKFNLEKWLSFENTTFYLEYLSQRATKSVQDMINKTESINLKKIDNPLLNNLQVANIFAKKYLKSYLEKNINFEIGKSLKIELLVDYYKKYYKIGDYYVLNNIAKMMKYKYLVIDTETNGLPIMKNHDSYYNYDDTSKYNNARMIQISYQKFDSCNNLILEQDNYIKPNGFLINNSHIHHITYEIALKNGISVLESLKKLYDDIIDVDFIVGHNIIFDINIIKSEASRLKYTDLIKLIDNKNICCTLFWSNELKKNNILTSVKLSNVYKHFTDDDMVNAHNSKWDVIAANTIFNCMLNDNLLLLPYLKKNIIYNDYIAKL